MYQPRETFPPRQKPQMTHFESASCHMNVLDARVVFHSKNGRRRRLKLMIVSETPEQDSAIKSSYPRRVISLC